MQAAHGQYQDIEQEGGALSLERAVFAVRRRIKLVLALPILVAGLTAGAVTLIPDRYDAVALIQIDPRQKSITNIDAVLPDLSADQPTIESEVEIIKSRPIALRVIEKLQLRRDAEFLKPGLFSRITSSIGLEGGTIMPQTLETLASAGEIATPLDPIAEGLDAAEPATFEPSRDEVAQAFHNRLSVARVRNTLLIEIRFTASDPAKAAKITNTIAEIYLKDQLAAKNGATATAARLLEQRITDMRGRVAQAERKVAEWKALNGVFDSEGELLSEKHLARLMEQTVLARNATSEARAKYEQARKLLRSGGNAEDLSEVLKSNSIQDSKQNLSAAERRASELATRYGPRHPEMIKVQAEVKLARRQLDDEIRRTVMTLHNEAQAAERRERELAQSLSTMKEQEIVRKDSGPELSELERDAIALKSLYESLLTRYRQTTETQGFQLPDARIIEKADVPLFAAGPKRKQLVLLATGASLVGAIGLALLLEIMTGGLVRPEDVEETLALPHLASTPMREQDTDTYSPARDVRRIIAEPNGRYAAAIRANCRELDRRAEGHNRIVLVVSALAGEGADILASNIAHNYAVRGASPLLIDADMRLQPLTRQLAPQRVGGLLDQIGTDDAIERAILRDSVTGLNFLPAAGQAPQNMPISAAITSGRLPAILDTLRDRFGTVIISAPPILPVMDARILADYADQVVLAVGWQKTPRQLVKKAIARIGYNAEKIAGVVLTDVAEGAMDSGDLMQSLMTAPSLDGQRDLYRDRAA